MWWCLADGDKFLVLTCPRPVCSVENLGDNWLYFLIPDGWKVLGKMENNLSGVGILSWQKPFGTNKAVAIRLQSVIAPIATARPNSSSGAISKWLAYVLGLCCAPRSRFLCCQNTWVWPAGKQKHQRSSSSQFVCLGPDFIAINVL